MQAELLEDLRNIPGALVLADEPLSRHVPLRLGGPADVWVTAEDSHALTAALSVARRHKASWRVCWPLGDWLVRDGGVRGLVIRLGSAFEGVRWADGLCWIGAASLWSALAGRPQPELLASLSGWSGSVGGLICGPDRERANGVVAALRVLRGRKVELIEVQPGEPVPELGPSAVLLEVALRQELVVQKGRRKPRLAPPPGSGELFATPDGEPAARLFGRAKLGGARLRAWRLTPSGTLVQLGGGTCRDVLLLAQGLQERLEKERGVTLQTRLPVVGTEPRA